MPIGTNDTYAANVTAPAEVEALVVSEAGIEWISAGYTLRESRNDIWMLAGGGHLRSGFPHYELGLDGDFGRIVLFPFDSIEEALRCHFAHTVQRLPNSGQTWRVEGGAGNVVESHDRDVLRHAQSDFLNGSDGADGRDIVVGEERSKRLLPCQQFLGKGITQHGRRIVGVDLHGQLRIDVRARSRRQPGRSLPSGPLSLNYGHCLS